MRANNSEGFLKFYPNQVFKSYKIVNDGPCFYFVSVGLTFVISNNQALYLNQMLGYNKLTITEKTGVENILSYLRGE